MNRAQRAEFTILERLLELRDFQPESSRRTIVTSAGRLVSQLNIYLGEFESLLKKLEERGIAKFRVSDMGLTWGDNKVTVENINWEKVEGAVEELNVTSQTAQKAKNAPSEARDFLKLSNLIDLKLRKVFRLVPDNETDVQDKFEDLLIGADFEYTRETDSIIYSSKTYTPDFSIPGISTAVEIKLCSHSKREKELIAEINDDILAYKQKYKNIVFVIYDTSQIRDIDKFKHHFEKEEGVLIKVVKH